MQSYNTNIYSLFENLILNRQRTEEWKREVGVEEGGSGREREGEREGVRKGDINATIKAVYTC